ncbi:MAG: antiterminator LoaP [Spirochaetales bacterium]|nr:antiterminator LoaP [Spirochaetales bacterium]
MQQESAKKNMKIYVIQVFSQGEEKFISLTMNALRSMGKYESEKDKLYWPRRTLERKKRGVKNPRTDALYPGYLFYRSTELEMDIYQMFKKIPGFVRFLKDNQNIEPLSREDEEILVHFISFGDIAETSKVFFDNDNMIQVIAGPLKGLEGKIVKVDKRKKRARVVLNLYKECFPIDLGFELMVPAEKSDETDKE